MKRLNAVLDANARSQRGLYRAVTCLVVLQTALLILASANLLVGGSALAFFVILGALGVTLKSWRAVREQHLVAQRSQKGLWP